MSVLFSLGIFARCLENPKRIPRLPGEIIWYCQSLKNLRALVSKEGDETPISYQPVLFQRFAGNTFSPHYAYQAHWATERILRRKPERHVDISSPNRFVVQLAASIPVSFYEFSPPDINVPNLSVGSASFEQLPFDDRSIQSISSLHVIEHIGLGRYGDKMSASGTLQACQELERVVAVDGDVYVSLPVGQPRIYFNSHRTFDPEKIIEYFPSLSLVDFSGTGDDGVYRRGIKPSDLAREEFGCGFYNFRRVS